MRISDWSSDVCSSDLTAPAQDAAAALRDRYEWVSLDEADLVVALGGDGFMLQTPHAMLDRRQPQCPVFGLNLDTVGFLMNEWRADGPEALLAHAKAAHVTRRCMEATHHQGEQPRVPTITEEALLRATRQNHTTTSTT